MKRKRKPKKKYEKSSDELLKIAEDEQLKGEITYKELLKALGHRAFGLALLIFTLPSALPFSMIPGVSVVFSIPLVIFGLQLLFASKSLWLPGFIANRTISHKKLAAIIKKALPYLKAVEHLFKPRFPIMNSVVAECITGLFITVLALLLMLPIPFSNFIIALILIIFALGISEKDGLAIALGWVATIIALVSIPTFFVAIFKAIF